jgi:hypothetical protein
VTGQAKPRKDFVGAAAKIMGAGEEQPAKKPSHDGLLITFARSADFPGEPLRRVVKQITRNDDGSYTTVKDYDNVLFWTFTVGHDVSLAAIEQAMREHCDGYTAIVPGVPFDTRPGQKQFRRSKPGQGKRAPTLYEVATRAWWLDVDGVDAPEGLDDPIATRMAAHHVIGLLAKAIPAARLEEAAVIVFTSANTGLSPSKIRLKLAFHLTETLTGAEKKALAIALEAASGVKLDPSIYYPHSVIYFDRPIFENCPDPIPRDDRMFLLPGNERVDVDALRSLIKKGIKQERVVRDTIRSTGGDWRAAIAQIGSDGHYRHWITSIVGLAVRRGAHVDDVIDALIEFAREHVPLGKIDEHFREDDLKQMYLDFADNDAREEEEVKRAYAAFEDPMRGDAETRRSFGWEDEEEGEGENGEPPAAPPHDKKDEPQPKGKPQLEVKLKDPEITVREVRKILAAADLIYDRGKIVRVVYDVVAQTSVAREMTPSAIAIAVHEAARPYKMQLKGQKSVPTAVDCAFPVKMATMYRDWGDWGLPPLNGIACSPLMSESGDIRTAHGYDKETGLWCENIPDIAPSVPTKPTKDQAVEALRVVRDAFKTFCFADAIMIDAGNGLKVVDLDKPAHEDESAFLTMLMTAVMRPNLWLAPGALFAGPNYSGAGVGKGLLMRSVCMLAFGRQPAAIPPGANREELEKRIEAEGIAGGPSMFFDNFNNMTLRSSNLSSMLSERPAKMRKLGGSEMFTLNELAFMGITGNGLLLAEDLVRRLIRIAFDAQVENPELREFATGFIETEIMPNRIKLLVALMTIWRWGRLNALTKGKSFGNYGQWCAWARDPLLTLGCRDPVERLTAMKQTDPGRSFLVALFNKWWEIHGDQQVTAHGLDDKIKEMINPEKTGRQYVTAFLNKLTSPPTRIGGYALTRFDPAGKWSAALYMLVRTTTEEDKNGNGVFGDSQNHEKRENRENENHAHMRRKDQNSNSEDLDDDETPF